MLRRWIDTQAGSARRNMLIVALAAIASSGVADSARADIFHDLRGASGIPMVIGTCFLSDGSGASGVFFMSGRTALGLESFGFPNLTDSHQIFTGSHSDNIQVARTWTTGGSTPVDGCTFFGPLISDGFALSVHGEGGHDRITAGGTIIVQGGSGNDVIFGGSSLGTSLLIGGADGDILWSSTSSTQEHLIGESGDDTLCLTRGDTGVGIVSGGAGFDCTTINTNATDIEIRRRDDCSGRCAN
jgi:hypothetical protein